MIQFQFGRILGQGSFGKVYQATYTRTKQRVAIKVLEKDKIAEKNDEKRVQRQIQILKMLNHVNIAKLYQVIETEQSINLIMEYAQQGDLLQHLKKQKKLSETETKRIIYQLSRAVNYIHLKGVVHRDIKMGNILLDKDFNVKLADFGLSNTFKEQETLNTSTGSPCFAAPQIIEGKEYYPKPCDVWSIGVVMYCLLSGNLPFYHQNIYQLYDQVINANYKRLTSVSKQAQQIISLTLNPNPSQRIQLPNLLAHSFFKELINQVEQSITQEKKKIICKALERLGFSSKQINAVLNNQSQFTKISITFQLLKKADISFIRKIIAHSEPATRNSTSRSIFLKRSGILNASNSQNINDSTSSQRRFVRSISEKKKLNPLCSMRKIKQNLQGIHYLKTPPNDKTIETSRPNQVSKFCLDKIEVNQPYKQILIRKNIRNIDLKQDKIISHKQIKVFHGSYNPSHTIECSLDDLKHKLDRKSIQLGGKIYQIFKEDSNQYRLRQTGNQRQLQDQIIKFFLVDGTNNIYLAKGQPNNQQMIRLVMRQLNFGCSSLQK